MAHPSFFVETALLTHGLPSISNDALLSQWPIQEPCLVWVDRGQITRGTIKDFLPFRARAKDVKRISYDSLPAAIKHGVSGALTASGTMRVAQEAGVKLAVTCGMGGIGNIVGEALCPDLPALKEVPVVLIATAPKDVVDIAATIQWLTENGVIVLGRYADECSGFMCIGPSIKLNGQYAGEPLAPPMLLLNPIDEAARLQDGSIITKAKEAGEAAQAQGAYYHPAANAKIDELSGGRSSLLQFRQLIENACWAGQLAERA